ncbi:MAG: OmpA family protein [Candidatus Binatia bacterium]
MRYPRFRRSVSGLAVGLAFFSGSASYGQDYSYDYGTDPYEGQQSERSYDRYDSSDPRPQTSYPNQAPQPSGRSGVPFGLNKSTAGAIAGGLLGAGSGAIIGSKTGSWGKGAAIGAGLGAVGGYLAGRGIQGRDEALDSQEQMILQQRQEIARNRALLEELKRRNLDVRETGRGVVVNLPDVLFEFNRASLTSGAQGKVTDIATVLKQRAGDRRISVEGHADAVGSESYNLALSQNRAQAVAQVLSYDGLSGRLVTQGYGEKYPVAPNTNSDGSDNPAGRAKNRRVEVVIEN